MYVFDVVFWPMIFMLDSDNAGREILPYAKFPRNCLMRRDHRGHIVVILWSYDDHYNIFIGIVSQHRTHSRKGPFHSSGVDII